MRKKSSRIVPILILLIIAVLIAIGSEVVPFLMSNRPAATATAAVGLEISPLDAQRLLSLGAVLIDVRTAGEYGQSRVAGSILIPLDELSGRLGEVPHDKQILVICRSGARSAQGRDILLAAGFSPVASVRGGILAWIAAGLPVEGSTP
jgi:rhodanese-related sulfurtransferase